MQNKTRPKLALLMTGDELIQGNIVDTNGSFLGDFFTQLGLEVEEKVTLGDNTRALVKQLLRLSKAYDIILMNGGLGPTEDDLTAIALAQAKDEPIQRHAEAEQHVMQWCKKRQLSISAANLKQADLPASATIFSNAPGSACAFYLYIGNCLIIATPGVPSELKSIVKNTISPFLQNLFQLNNFQLWQRYQLFGIGESSLQEIINQHFHAAHEDYLLGFRANFPYLELKLKAKHQHAKAELIDKLLAQLQDKQLGENHFSLASSLVQTLTKKGQTLASAESCTGGLIASEITKIAGSSLVFPGSIVSYSNSAKHELLQVSEASLQQHGAVSSTVVEQMFLHCLKAFHSDYAIAVSGIAGPTGGSAEKPTGTVFIAFGSRHQYAIARLCIPLPREDFQQLVCAIALDLLRRQILGYSLQPRYLSRWQVQWCDTKLGNRS